MARRGLTPFGRRVHKRMIDLNITHSELSRRIGCSQSYLTDILAGRRGGGKYMEPICRELNIRYQANSDKAM